MALVSVCVRIGYLATASGVSFRYPLIDADYYDSLAVDLARGEGWPEGPFWQPPLYPMLLATLYGLLGHSLWWPRLLQCALSVLGSVMVFQLTERLTRHRGCASLSGFAYALCGPLVFYDGELLPTSLASFLALLVGWLGFRERPSPAHAVLGGACVGLAGLAVAPMLLLIVPLTFALRRVSAKLASVALAVALVVVSCATAANVIRTGEWVLISANGGVNFWIGNNPSVAQMTAIRPGAGWEELIDEPAQLGIVSASAQDAYFYRKALDFCADDPWKCLQTFVWKARLTFVAREIPRNENLSAVRSEAPVLAALTARVGQMHLPGVLLWPFALAGTYAASRSRERAWGPVLLMLAMLLLPSVLYFPTGRYRAPAIAYACVLAAAFVKGLVQGHSTRRGSLVVAALGLLLSSLSSDLPIDAVNFAAEMHAAAADRCVRLGEHAAAVPLLQKAIELRPHYFEAQFNLALAFEEMGQRSKAIETYRAILREVPDETGAMLRLAALLMTGGRAEVEEAESLYAALVAQFPGDGLLRLGLAECLLYGGKREQAAQSLDAARQALGTQHPEVQRVRELVSRTGLR